MGEDNGYYLNDIKLKKELLRNEILKDNQKIEKLWGKLFHKAPLFDKQAKPSKKLGSLLSTGASLLDGAILGWKLYRKFRP